MELIIIPEDSFEEKDKKETERIVSLAEKSLKKNKISLPKKIYFFNSFPEFIKKVLPEVENYGFNKEISEEIIKCALNNGTYGTIDYGENSIIEMNFNPFNNGRYSSMDFLELIIHESLHLHLSKKLNKDINKIKFKFDKEKYAGNSKIIQLDEGYAEFMTKKILANINTKEIGKINLPITNSAKPSYKKSASGLNIELFDKNFEMTLISNRDAGAKYFSDNLGFNDKNEEILEFAVNRLKNII